MKLKNVKIGMKVQVKNNADIISNWYPCSTGCLGEVIGVDLNSERCSVFIRYEDGRREWGGHKGLRKVKGDK